MITDTELVKSESSGDRNPTDHVVRALLTLYYSSHLNLKSYRLRLVSFRHIMPHGFQPSLVPRCYFCLAVFHQLCQTLSPPAGVESDI